MVKCDHDDCAKEFDTNRAKNIHISRFHDNVPDEINSRDSLATLYYENDASLSEIAEKFDVNISTVRTAFECFDIPRRHSSYYSDVIGETALSEEEVSEVLRMYRQGMTGPQISDEMGCGSSTVYNVLERNGLEKRSPGEYMKMFSQDEHTEVIKEYENSNSIREVADHYGVSGSLISKILNQHGVDTTYDHSGSNNGNWKGGSMDSYYGPNWSEQRQKRLEKDGYECVVCGMTQREHKNSFGSELSVHHLVPRRRFIDESGFDYERANRVDNLVSLCVPCHQKWEGMPVIPNE
jgi:transposase